MFEYIAVFGALVNIAGSLVYVKHALTGKSKPNRVTYFLWSLAPFIGTGAALAQGVTWAALSVFSAGFCPFMIFCASFFNKNAVWKLRAFDWICGASSLAALLLWAITDEPNIAILFAILTDGAAGLPTLKKCWTHPETETLAGYAAGIFSAFTGLLVIKEWSFAEAAFPLYLTMLCALFTLIIVARRRFLAGLRPA